jgi:hypothetical protein
MYLFYFSRFLLITLICVNEIVVIIAIIIIIVIIIIILLVRLFPSLD